MSDAAVVAITVGFAVLTAGFVILCDRLMGKLQ
jgi:hypothetical protein